MRAVPEVVVLDLPPGADRGRAATAAAERVLHRAWEPEPPVFEFRFGAVEVPAPGPAGLVLLGPSRSRTLAGWAVRRRVGAGLTIPRAEGFAVTGEALRIAVPFAPGAGLEVALAIDVARAGFSRRELPTAGSAPRASPREAVAVLRALLDRR